MRLLSNESLWAIDPPSGSSYEIVVAGDSVRPAPARLALVGAAVESIEELKSKAVAYLDDFVDRSKVGAPGDWFFEGVESGRVPGEAEDQCSFYFSIETDPYGEWSVTFQDSQSRFYPVAFSRRQV